MLWGAGGASHQTQTPVSQEGTQDNGTGWLGGEKDSLVVHGSKFIHSNMKVLGKLEGSQLLLWLVVISAGWYRLEMRTALLLCLSLFSRHVPQINFADNLQSAVDDLYEMLSSCFW